MAQASAYSVDFPGRSYGGKHINSGFNFEFGEREYERDIELGLSSTSDEAEAGYKLVMFKNSFRWNESTVFTIAPGFGEFDNGVLSSGSQEFSLEGDPGFGWRIGGSYVFLTDYIGVDWYTNIQYSSFNSDPRNGSMSYDDSHVAVGFRTNSGLWYYASGIRFSNSTMEASGTSTTGNSASVDGTANVNVGAYFSSKWHFSENYHLLNALQLGDEIGFSVGIGRRFGRPSYGSAYEYESK